MRRVLVLLVLALLATSSAAPSAVAQVPPLPLPDLPGGGGGNNTTSNATVPTGTLLNLYLSSTTAQVPGKGLQEALVAAAPSKTNDSARSESSSGLAWYQPGGSVPLLAGAHINGPVNGTTWISLSPNTTLPLGVLGNATFRFELRKVSSTGNETSLGSGTGDFTSHLATGSAVVEQLNWSIATLDANLTATDSLALNITATVTNLALGDLQVLYDNAAHPSGFSLRATQLARGSITLSSANQGKEVAPGAAAVYVLQVRNLGTDTDTVTLSSSGSPSDWNVVLSASSVQVAPGGVGQATLSITPPSSAADGTRHTAVVNATSTLGGTANLLLSTTARAGAGSGTGSTLDSDHDGYTDLDEKKYGSDPNDPNSTPENTDSDGDGISNKAETDAGCDPFNANDVPLPSGGCGRPGSANTGTVASTSPLAALSKPIAEALNVSSDTADLISVALILLFLLILLLLILLLVRSYPVKISLTEARAVTEPGRAADYNVIVVNKLNKPQTVDLEIAQVPNDWDVRFAQPRLTLEAKTTESVGLLIRPPDNWPAPSKREFQVRARSRFKPGSFAKVLAKMLIQPAREVAAEPLAEEGVAEPDAFPPQAPEEDAFAPAPRRPVPLPAGPARQPPFRVRIGDVRHDPPAPERGGEVTTSARIDNEGNQVERVRILLVVNGKVRDEVDADLEPGEGAEAEFHWVAYLARNEVKVVAERS